jgi:hypothetical protein
LVVDAGVLAGDQERGGYLVPTDSFVDVLLVGHELLPGEVIFVGIDKVVFNDKVVVARGGRTSNAGSLKGCLGEELGSVDTGFCTTPLSFLKVLRDDLGEEDLHGNVGFVGFADESNHFLGVGDDIGSDEDSDVWAEVVELIGRGDTFGKLVRGLSGKGNPNGVSDGSYPGLDETARHARGLAGFGSF